MRITVDIDEKQLRKIQQATGQKKKSPAVRRALDEFVAERQRKEFLRKVLEGRTDYAASNDDLETRAYDGG